MIFDFGDVKGYSALNHGFQYTSFQNFRELKGLGVKDRLGIAASHLCVSPLWGWIASVVFQ
jgi:hypothetical protein